MVDNNTVVNVDAGALALGAPAEKGGIPQQSSGRDFVMDGEPETSVSATQPVIEKTTDQAGSEDNLDDNQADKIEGADDAPAKPKRPGGLTRKLTRLEQENANLRAQLEQRTSAPADVNRPLPQTVEASADKPRLEQFQDYESYTQALVDWRVEQRERTRQQQAVQADLANKAKSYQAKAEEARQRYTDYDDVVNDYDGPVSVNLQRALVESDLGPDVAYYLGQNIDTLEKLNTMDALNVGREIGKIEARIAAQHSNKLAGSKITKAPPPVNPVGSSKVASTVNPDDMSFEDYKEWRRKTSSR